MTIVNSAGLFIIYNDEVLLIHPTNANWKDSFQIPKGIMEDFETKLQTAIRETKEEVGLIITENMIDRISKPGIIEYRKSNKLYKRVYYYIVRLKEKPEIINLQLEEVDWAKFVPYEEAKKMIFWRFRETLDNIFQ